MTSKEPPDDIEENRQEAPSPSPAARATEEDNLSNEKCGETLMTIDDMPRNDSLERSRHGNLGIHLLRIEFFWALWLFALLFHTDLGLMPLFHGKSVHMDVEEDPEKMQLIFWGMLIYFLVPLFLIVLNTYLFERKFWRWFHFVLGIIYSITNAMHFAADIPGPESRSDQVTLMFAMVVIGVLINYENWYWCRDPIET